MEPGREERGDKGRVGRGALADRHVIYSHKFWGLTGRETWAGRPTPQTLNPGWAFLEPTPGVTPPRPHTYPSQPQTHKASQVRAARRPDGPALALHPKRGRSLRRPAPPPAGSRAGAKDDSSGAPHTRALVRQRLRSVFVCLDQDTNFFSQNPIKLILLKRKMLRDTSGEVLGEKVNWRRETPSTDS